MSPERRERRSFEPPPWERQQFDELQRQASEEAAQEPSETQEEADASAAPAGAEHGVQEGPSAQQAPAQAPSSAGSESTQADTAALLAAVPEVRKETAQADSAVDPARMAELMAELKSEDPPASGFWKLGLAVAAGMGVLGAVMMIWGIVGLQATRDSGQLGWMGAAVLISFGVGFIGVAAWFAYKNLEKRGVL